jgi:hypothetical protein
MEKDYRRELEALFEQTLKFLQVEGLEEGQPQPIFERTGIGDIFYNEPEKSLQRDRLMFLFKNL